jgi:hypothetical protein
MSVVMSIMMSVVMPVMMPVVTYVKVRQHKEPREPEIPPPKRIRHPTVKVCIIRRRGIIRDYRWPFIVIVIAHRLSVRIIRWRSCIRSRV